MLINQLAKKTETPIHTIRYYENYGLFKGKKMEDVTSNNYSYYDEDVVEKVELIKHAKELGFSLSEIKTLIDAWYNEQLSVSEKKEILEAKIKEIDEKIRHFKEMKKLILEAIDDVENLKC